MIHRRSWGAAILALAALALPAFAGEIHDAVERGDLATVTRLLAEDPARANEPNSEQRFSYRPLHYAATSGNVEIARALLAAGAELEGGDSDESTPLQVAALNRQLEMIDFLIGRGADVNRRDKNGAYALSFAASGGDSLVVKRVLAAGADLNLVSPGGITLLFYAVSRDLPGLFDLLAARGDDVNVANDEGQTPLHWSVRREDTAMTRRLLDAGASVSAPDSFGMTPLVAAAFAGQATQAALLLERGADPNEAISWGGTALYAAARGGNEDLARLLIEKGADVNRKLESGEPLLGTAVEAGNVEIVRMLLAAGATADVADAHWGQTPLHTAALRGYADIAAALLEGGASPDVKDHEGRAPLQLAAACGHDDVVRMLAPGGADVARECPADFRDLGDREAVVWHLGHSGWAVKTENHLMIFDYFNRDREPSAPGLCNGFVNPDELAGEHVTVFASHVHSDHYDPVIFAWREKLRDVTYVLGCRPEDVPPYEFVEGREERTIHGIKVTTITSNDTGVGFLVEADGMVIYHAGDHANRQRDFSGPYKAEIDWLAEKGVRPDLAFLPVSGCGFGDQEAVKMGVHYALETLKPFVFLPMHAGGNTYRYREFIDECKDRFPDTRMEAAEYRGDHFRYHKGKIS